ncbi:MAG TPA: ABC transporter permease [Patescibacteria group bacterium]|nr:ABC transporter permease [Patescibacteria group bacterium]
MMETTLKKTLNPKVKNLWNVTWEKNLAGRLVVNLGQSLYNQIAVIIFVILWEIAPRAGWVPQTFIAPPSVVLSTLWDLLSSGVLMKHIQVSLNRATLGFLAAVLIGIPLGFFLGGWFKLFERVVTPVLRLFNAVNPFTLFPIFILLFGIGEFSKMAIIFWVCLWPILLNTITGVKSVDPLLIKSARSMGIGTFELFHKVILLAAAPNIFHGVKTSCGVAFFMLIAAEMIGASSGLGWLVFNAQVNYQIPKLFAATVTISVLGLSLNYAFSRLEQYLISWKEDAAEY